MRGFVLAALVSVAAGATAKAEVSARVWMLDHANPNTDELAELKVENPDAYALVKALLTKRSLGLLDPRHPTASFSKPAPEDESNHPVGAAVYAKFATTDKERQALANAEPVYDTSAVEDDVVTPAPSGQHDWLNWKPADSAASDDAMVQNVLGSVAGLVGKKTAVPGTTTTQPSVGALDADESSILSADDVPKQEAKPEPKPEPQPKQNFLAKISDTPKPQSNSYLDGLDLTVDTKPDAPAVTSQPAQPIAEPVVPVTAAESSVSGGKSALDNFSFSDSDDQTTTTAPKVQTPAPKVSALGSWLGMVQPHVQKAVAPVTTAAPPDANPYLTDLQ
jgi:hypothetical protein